MVSKAIRQSRILRATVPSDASDSVKFTRNSIVVTCLNQKLDADLAGRESSDWPSQWPLKVWRGGRWVESSRAGVKCSSYICDLSRNRKCVVTDCGRKRRQVHRKKTSRILYCSCA